MVGIRLIESTTFEKSQSKVLINRARILAIAKAKTFITAFLRGDQRVPRDTGRMAETAVNSLQSSPSSGKLRLNIQFSTEYAKFVEERFGFIGKIRPSLIRIAVRVLRSAYESAGVKANVGVTA